MMKPERAFWKKAAVLLLVLCMAIGVMPLMQPEAAKKTSFEMNIYAWYLNSTEKGEAVLLESKGNYLVMDLGMSDCTRTVVKELQSMGIDHIGLYFSHLHKDHIGASDDDMMVGLNMLAAAGISVDTLYLPDPSLASESAGYTAKYERLQNFMAGRGEIVYLKLGSEFKIGDADFTVMGPVHPEKFHPKDYENEETDPDGDSLSAVSYTYYENNCSLITSILCGNTVYLTMGDALKDEISQTVKLYGGVDGLQVDILKLSHHGTGSGNVAGMLKSTAAKYVFAQNTGYTGVNAKTGKWYCRQACTNAQKRGMPFFIGNEKRTIIYHVADDVVTMYQGSLAEENKLTGWQRVYGGDGTNNDYDYYYLDENGQIVTGLQKIDDHYYEFSETGRMVFGSYNEDGTYSGWVKDSYGRKYYGMLEDGRVFVGRGLTLMPEDGKYHYFDINGYLLEGTGEMQTKKIGNYEYAFDAKGAALMDVMQVMPTGETAYFDNRGRRAYGKVVTYMSGSYYIDQTGAMAHDQLYEQDGSSYYFGTDGQMVKNRYCTVDGVDYYFKEDGSMARNEFVTIDGREYYFDEQGLVATERIVTDGAIKYYVDASGNKVKDKMMSVGTDTYYFGSDGQMVKKQFIDMNGNTCYFGKKGTLLKDQLVRIAGKRYYLNADGYVMKKAQAVLADRIYYFNKSGAMVTSSKVKMAGHTYYFGKNGAMVKNKKVKINGASYYFNENGVMETKQYVQLGSRWYYCGKTGKMKVAKNYDPAA